jgi:putative transposase
MIDQAVTELAPVIGFRRACVAVGEAQARWYRRHRQSPPPPKPERVPALQPRALSEVERKELRAVLNSEDHVDEAPATVYAKLLDEGVYLGSVSTMYRVLRDHDEVRERRRQATHPAAKKPELLATKPNQCWSWDITKLLGPEKWTYYYLYVIIDIYSRYVPGWMLAHAENAKLAEALLADTVTKQNIGHGQLTIHADRGSPMTAKPVAFLLADLGVTKSHSRPHCSNDNPFSESQFRTLKYPARLPRPLRQLRTRTCPLHELLRLVQRRAPPLRHRVPHRRRCPPRASRARPSTTRRRPQRRLRRAPRTLRPQATQAAPAACRGVDQRAEGGHRYNTVILRETCLRNVDTRRPARVPSSRSAWVIQFVRHDSEIPKSAATSFIRTPGPRLRATRITSSRNSQIGPRHSKHPSSGTSRHHTSDVTGSHAAVPPAPSGIRAGHQDRTSARARSTLTPASSS